MGNLVYVYFSPNLELEHYLAITQCSCESQVKDPPIGVSFEWEYVSLRKVGLARNPFTHMKKHMWKRQQGNLRGSAATSSPCASLPLQIKILRFSPSWSLATYNFLFDYKKLGMLQTLCAFGFWIMNIICIPARILVKG